VRKGYKQTEIGIIPEDWKVCQLQDLAVKSTPITYGVLKPGEYVPNGIPLLQIQDVIHGEIKVDELHRISTSLDKQYSRTKLSGGEIVISLIGTVGKIASIPITLAGANIHRNLARIRISTEYCSKFIFHYLKSEHAQQAIKLSTFGSTQALFNLFDLRTLLIAIPSYAEQEAIAEALSDADALIGAVEQLLAKKRQVKQGAMSELLTGKRRLSGFSGEWQEKSLLELAEGKKELFDDGDWIEAEHITDEGVRLVQTGNIGIGRFVEKEDKKYIYPSSFVSLHCKELRQGDLLICRLAEPAGRACVFPDIGDAKVITSVDVTIFRPPASIANRVFLANIFSTNQWFREINDKSGGTTHKRISRGSLGRIKIKLPHIAEQTAIAEILSDMDAEITALEEKLVKARQVKAGMMSELLTGKIRLV